MTWWFQHWLLDGVHTPQTSPTGTLMQTRRPINAVKQTSRAQFSAARRVERTRQPLRSRVRVAPFLSPSLFLASLRPFKIKNRIQTIKPTREKISARDGLNEDPIRVRDIPWIELRPPGNGSAEEGSGSVSAFRSAIDLFPCFWIGLDRIGSDWIGGALNGR